jgi:hypothetical protein
MPGLEQYLDNTMRPRAGIPPVSWPLPDEHHLSWWRQMAAVSAPVIHHIAAQLPQAQIAIEAGISASPHYAAAVFRGEPVSSKLGRASYEDPSALTLHIHPHAAGSLPVLETSSRVDFVHLYRSFSARCEPVDVPDGVHAVFVSGVPNPSRMRQMKGAWKDESSWPTEMDRLLAEDRSWFYDRMIFMQRGAYGGVSASHVSPTMTEQEWVERSSVLRLEHECTHYATSRLLGSFRLNIHDELIADFMGFTKSLGTFSAGLFLEAMGIEGDSILEGARFHHYTVGLNEAEVCEVCAMMIHASASLEVLAHQLPDDVCRPSLVLALGQVGLLEMGGSPSWIEPLVDGVVHDR